jgi:hypothetical protein
MLGWCWAGTGLADPAEPTCVDFLKISTVPRVAALGEATVAVSDATWAEANPGNLTGIDGTLMTFSHTAWFQDISLEMLTFGTSTGRHGFGVSVVGLHTDALDRYDESDTYLGSFHYFDFLLSATYAMAPMPYMRLGITGKTIYEKIDWDSATGYAIDFGLGYSRPVSLLRGGLSGGLALRNLGPKMGYFSEDYDLPLSWQAGASYRPAWLPRPVTALVACDYRETRGYDGGVLLGMEVGLVNMVALRLGHRGDFETSGLTLGAGLAFKNMTFDYAYTDLGANLGGTHRISLSLRTRGILLPREE